MALMYDMETVNKAMTEAAKLYDPKKPSIRVKRVLDIFAGMKPVEAPQVVHGRWESCFEDWRHQLEGNKCSVCGFEYYGNLFQYCPNCGAIMDGRPENG